MPVRGPNSDTRWVDGLRGIAALLVVNAHVARSIAPALGSPAIEDHGPPVLWQLPIIRNFFMGRASVAIFAVIVGFVNSLKPLKLIRDGDVSSALPAVARAAFRRVGRLFLPATLMTCLTWFVCQLGVFLLGSVCDWYWIRLTSPEPSLSFWAALGDLYLSIGRTWAQGSNKYDAVQWTLPYLLRGSMLVYVTLFAVAFVQSRYRYAIYLAMWIYYFWLGDAVVGMNVYFGLFLAELHHDPRIHPRINNPPLHASLPSTLAIFTGMFIMSYPETNQSWAAWSSFLDRVGHVVFPSDSELDRYWAAIGTQLTCLGLCFSPWAKSLLSSTLPVWMGKVSLPVYLLHGPLMRSVLVYLVFGWSKRPEPVFDRTTGTETWDWVPAYNGWVTTMAVVLFYLLLYRMAAVWVRLVDPWCSRVARWIEEGLFVSGAAEDEKAERLAIREQCERQS